MDVGIGSRAVDGGGMVTRRAGVWAAATFGSLALLGCFNKIPAPTCLAQSFTVTDTLSDTLVTSRGLQYIEVTAGTGAPLPWCTQVTVDYDAYLLDSTKFDSSRDFFFNDPAAPGIYTLSLHYALPVSVTLTDTLSGPLVPSRGPQFIGVPAGSGA